MAGELAEDREIGELCLEGIDVDVVFDDRQAGNVLQRSGRVCLADATL